MTKTLIEYQRGRRRAVAAMPFDVASANNAQIAGQLLFYMHALDSDTNSFTVTNAVATERGQFYTLNNLVLDGDSNSFAVI